MNQNAQRVRQQQQQQQPRRSRLTNPPHTTIASHSKSGRRCLIVSQTFRFRSSQEMDRRRIANKFMECVCCASATTHNHNISACRRQELQFINQSQWCLGITRMDQYVMACGTLWCTFFDATDDHRLRRQWPIRIHKVVLPWSVRILPVAFLLVCHVTTSQVVLDPSTVRVEQHGSYRLSVHF